MKLAGDQVESREKKNFFEGGVAPPEDTMVSSKNTFRQSQLKLPSRRKEDKNKAISCFFHRHIAP